MLLPQAAESLSSGLPHSTWTDIPSLYVVCELDRAILPSVQREHARRLLEGARQTSIISLQTGHAPFLAKTKELAALIVRASTADP